MRVESFGTRNSSREQSHVLATRNMNAAVLAKLGKDIDLLRSRNDLLRWSFRPLI